MSDALLQTLPELPQTGTWEAERIFADGDDFFGSLIAEISRAKVSIDLEIYIFETDDLGQRLLAALKAAAARKVRVRVMVDGVGSPGWNRETLEALVEQGVQARIYRPYPWIWGPKSLKRILGFRRFQRWAFQNNRRNHRKTCVIDGKSAWVGSFNISNWHLKEFSGENAWRDTGARVEGEEIGKIRFAFERTWVKAWGLHKIKMRFFKRIRWSRGVFGNPDSLVRLNFAPFLRRRFYRDLQERVLSGRERVWITMAYFNPRRSLMRVLRFSAQRGMDVRVLIPKKTDVRFMRWVATATAEKLLAKKVKVYEYLPTVLHAKTVLIDDWATVGSSNWNHRSFIHDLEIDVVTRQDASLAALNGQFLNDLSSSEELTLEILKERYWLEKFLGRLFLFFKAWL